jgi:hypothetical protein
MMWARKSAVIGAAALGALALATTPAAAHVVRAVSSFQPEGIEGSWGVAVDQATGDVYVAGLSSNDVKKFSATGVEIRTFQASGLGGPAGVAVDNSADAAKGDVYIAEYGGDEVIRLSGDGATTAGFTPITASSFPPGDPGSSSFGPLAVAVDPANGDVVVADHPHSEVDIFSSSGTFISQFAVRFAGGVAVGSGHEIFTASPEGVGALAWSPADGYSTPTSIDPEDPFAIGVDLATGDVLAGDSSDIAEYTAALTPGLQFGSGLVESPRGVAVNEATDTVYVSEPERGLVYIFGKPLEFASSSTGVPATNVTSTTANVSGTAEPEGTTVKSCRFEYGLSTSYTGSGPCLQPPPFTGSGAVAVSEALVGLQPNATYHYRLVVATADGSSYGEDQTFQTNAAPPTLANASVSALTQTEATLNASIDPNNEETTYRFEFGETTGYGTVLPAGGAIVGSGYGNVVVAQQLSGLRPGATYHFRVVTTNASSPPGGGVGVDQSFTTPSVQLPVASTDQATGVGQNTAVLAATIDARGFGTVYEFDLGTDTSYGTQIFGEARPEAGQQTVVMPLQDLAAGTTYHYRILARNAFGTSYGVDEAFTTASFPSSTLTAPSVPALVPTALLAMAGVGGGTAKTASVERVADVARGGGLTGKRSVRRVGRRRGAKSSDTRRAQHRQGGGKS